MGRSVAATRAAPLRSSIDPADFSDLVTQVFLIGREGSGAYPLRLAGALLDDLHRGPLVGLDFVQLWAATDRPRIQTAVEAALDSRRPLVATAQGRSSDAQAKLEILLAPLADGHGKVQRMLGFYQPVSPPVPAAESADRATVPGGHRLRRRRRSPGRAPAPRRARRPADRLSRAGALVCAPLRRPPTICGGQSNSASGIMA
ncbi:MAG: PAS domain-containing protein [Caulobacteraceae bacterium]